MPTLCVVDSLTHLGQISTRKGQVSFEKTDRPDREPLDWSLTNPPWPTITVWVAARAEDAIKGSQKSMLAESRILDGPLMKKPRLWKDVGSLQGQIALVYRWVDGTGRWT